MFVISLAEWRFAFEWRVELVTVTNLDIYLRRFPSKAWKFRLGFYLLPVIKFKCELGEGTAKQQGARKLEKVYKILSLSIW